MEYYKGNYTIPEKNPQAHMTLKTLQIKLRSLIIFFASVGKNTYEQAQQTLDRNHIFSVDLIASDNVNNTERFRPEPVDTDTVISAIKSLKETLSVGSDGISLNFTKDGLYVIAFYFTCIINASIVIGAFPQAWKHAFFIPIFKNGDPDKVNNYRPISLLPIVSKLLEKIVSNQLLAFLENTNSLSTCQHGFRPKFSTQSALTVITDTIYSNMDKKKISLTLRELSWAFDSVCQ